MLRKDMENKIKWSTNWKLTNHVLVASDEQINLGRGDSWQIIGRVIVEETPPVGEMPIVLGWFNVESRQFLLENYYAERQILHTELNKLCNEIVEQGKYTKVGTVPHSYKVK